MKKRNRNQWPEKVKRMGARYKRQRADSFYQIIFLGGGGGASGDKIVAGGNEMARHDSFKGLNDLL
jgi:hypothetical protein